MKLKGILNFINTLSFRIKLILILDAIIPLILYITLFNITAIRNLVPIRFYQILIVAAPTILIFSAHLERFIVRPIKNLGKNVSAIKDNNEFMPQDIKGAAELEAIGEQINSLAENIKAERTERERLEKLSFLDKLTSLYSREYFFEYFQKKLSQAKKAHNIALIYCSIDKFDELIDFYGISVTDTIISKVASVITIALYSGQLAFRYGENSFVIVLDGYNSQQAFIIGDRIRCYMNDNAVIKKFSNGVPITISAGIAEYPSDGNNILDIIKNVVSALEVSRKYGGNQCRIYSPEMHELVAVDFNKWEVSEKVVSIKRKSN